MQQNCNVLPYCTYAGVSIGAHCIEVGMSMLRILSGLD